MAAIMLVSLCAIVSTTSVSAVASSANATTSKPSSASVSTSQSSSANVQSGLVGAPAGIVGAPAACSQGANSLDLFIRGTDNALWWRNWTSATGWSAWQSLGGVITSSPGATSAWSGQLTVAARGGDGALWRRVTTDGGASWDPWLSRGGQLLAGTGPALVITASQEVRYFVIGTDHQLYWRTSSSLGWASLGGYLTSSPSAVAFSEGGIYVAARGGNGALYEKITPDGGTTWEPWLSFGGQLLAGTGPAVVKILMTNEFFVIGTDHQLYWYNGSWQPSLGGYLTSGPAAASSPASVNTIDAFAVGGNGALWSRNTTNGGTSWNPWYKAMSF